MSLTRVLQSAPISKMSPVALVIFNAWAEVHENRETHELRRGLGYLTSPVEGITRLVPGQSKVRNIRRLVRSRLLGAFDGSHLKLCKQLPSFLEIGGTSFKYSLKLLVKRAHLRGRHVINLGRMEEAGTRMCQ